MPHHFLVGIGTCPTRLRRLRPGIFIKTSGIFLLCIFLSGYLRLEDRSFRSSLRTGAQGGLTENRGSSGGDGDGVVKLEQRRLRRISHHLEPDRQKLQVQLNSGISRVELYVDGIPLVNSSKSGFHVFVLNQATGSLMAHRVFKFYEQAERLSVFLRDISAGRLLLCALASETATTQFPALPALTVGSALASLGSRFAASLRSSENWAFAAFSKVGRVDELRGKSQPIQLRVEITLTSEEEPLCPSWTESPETLRRRAFCRRADGYGNVCSCVNPSAIDFQPPALFNNSLSSIPVVLLTRNRPHYLYRTLTSLLNTPGVNKTMVTVDQLGFHEEPRLVASLFGVRSVQHRLAESADAVESSGNVWSQHLRLAVASGFKTYPLASHMLLLDDDIELSPDFFHYFSQTLPVLMKDDADLMCVGAWNPQGYAHTSTDVQQMYRVEHLTTRGAWLLPRTVWQNQLAVSWPESPSEATRWLQSDFLRRGRTCLVPQLSRVYSFGEAVASQRRRVFNQQSVVKLNTLKYISSKKLYRSWIRKQLHKATIFNGKLKFCDRRSFLKLKNEILVLVFYARSMTEVRRVWPRLSKCFLLHYSPTCFHDGVCFFNFLNNSIALVAHPLSVHSKSLLPTSVSPLHLDKNWRRSRLKSAVNTP